VLVSVGLPAAVIAASHGVGTAPADRASLGRLAFMVAIFNLAWFLYTVLRPQGGAIGHYLAAFPQSLLNRLRYLWLSLAVGTPILLGVLAALGYYYSSAQLSQELVSTMWLVVGLLVARDLLLRWLTVARRKVAWQLARDRREAARAARAAREAGEAPQPVVEEPEIDLQAIDAQTRKLVGVVLSLAGAVGLWLVWESVLPALGLLKQVDLWQRSVGAGAAEHLEAITLADLLLALVVAVITASAARNLPGLLQITLLQYLEPTPGGIYAVKTLVQYAVVAVGTVLFFNTIGGSWTQIQWLVAALGVGLGFGLQEIFGNFVSGLVILFERPVRAGDIVTVGDLSGTVSRIQIRATTIIDADRREIIVPNKAFITERVVNWSLTDTVTRVTAQVGVSYRTDPEQAHRVILEAVRSVPLVLADPEPRVLFMGFGDNALSFTVYAFVADPASRLTLVHELHMAIARALREHGIEIPFPQRDLHLRTDALRVAVAGAGRGETPAPVPGRAPGT
jgi:potassium efflux system protein